MNYPWIEEAKKHIGLKEIPGTKNSPVITGWLKVMGAWWNDDETPWCFTGDTEILTEAGWVRLDKVTDDQRVYQADSRGELSIAPIIRRIEKDYNGDVFNIGHRNLNITCDAGHRWWGNFNSSSNDNGYRFGTLDEVPEYGLQVPSVFSGNQDCGLTPNQLWLLAAFICDGKLRYSESEENKNKKVPTRIEFEVSKCRKIQMLDALEPTSKYTQKRAYGPLTKTPLTVYSFKYPDYFYNCLSDYKTLSQDFINKLSINDAKVFLQAYAYFDGNGDIDKSPVIYTSDELMLQHLLQITTMAGLHVSIQINRFCSVLTKKTAYRLLWTNGKEHRSIDKSKIVKGQYTGKLYCVQVPEGRIVVKKPGYSPILTGNCGVFTGYCMKAAKISYPKLYMRASEWANWGVKLDTPVDGCVVVFNRKGGGHVGFVMGQTKDGFLSVLGGNQGNAVTVAKFDRTRVVGYYWPKEVPVPVNKTLSIVSVTGGLSTNEA